MKSTPSFTAKASLYKTGGGYLMGGSPGAQTGAREIQPQACVSSPCITVPASGQCITLLGRRVCLPPLGRWRVSCCTRWGWPPVSCSINRC